MFSNDVAHYYDVLGPVVQSIVSLTTSFRRYFVKYMPTTLSNPLLFVLKKCETAKDYVFNFIETLTNNVVNFEQPVPGHAHIILPS